MIIKANEREISVTSVISDKMKSGGKTYPALRFEFAGGISDEDIAVLSSGSLELIDEETGEVLGVQEGYNTVKCVSLLVGKITPDEARIAELEAELAAAQAQTAEAETANAELQDAINVIVGGNAE